MSRVTRLAKRVTLRDIHGEQMSTLGGTGQRVGKTIAPQRVRSLPEGTSEELRAVLARQLKEPEKPLPELENLMQRVARDARQRNIPPEELIVDFKEIWNSLAEAMRPQHADQFERVRQSLVTLSIQAYYAE